MGIYLQVKSLDTNGATVFTCSQKNINYILAHLLNFLLDRPIPHSQLAL